ncbi:MAG: NADH-quinone oxidoreductase subunit L, partial [Limnobacter sp.]
MDSLSMLLSASALAPTVSLAAFALLAHLQLLPERALWRGFRMLMILLLVSVPLTAFGYHHALNMPAGLKLTLIGVVMTLLVQLLGTIIGSFSSRYLHGEAGQSRYLAALAAVMSAVHLLLISDHW